MKQTKKTVRPSLAESAMIWYKLGLLSFGGPTAQIALMHRLIVAEHRWLNESQFLNALSFCMLLPGPEAMQLAIYTGWRTHGVLGGLLAGLLFVLPGALIMLGLGLLYVTFGTFGLIGAAFLGLKAAIVVIVLQALIRLAQKSLKTIEQWIIAAIGFVGIFIFTAFSTYYWTFCLIWVYQQATTQKLHFPQQHQRYQSPRHYQNGFNLDLLVVGTITGA